MLLPLRLINLIPENSSYLENIIPMRCNNQVIVSTPVHAKQLSSLHISHKKISGKPITSEFMTYNQLEEQALKYEASLKPWQRIIWLVVHLAA
jgi:hypothetical protein